MESIALTLFAAALKDAALLALPVVGVVAIIGVVLGIVQTVVQVQDQNVVFAPKLAAVACMIAAMGPAGLDALRALFTLTIHLLPRLAHA